MIRGRNIIALASNWHFDPTSKHHVMKILSRENNILWVNYHGSRRPQVSLRDVRSVFNKLEQFTKGPEAMSDSFQVMTPLLLPFPESFLARRVNQQLVVRQIRQALRKFPSQPIQLWSFAPDAGYLAGRFDEELVVYYCVDEFSQFSHYAATAIQELEKEMIGRSDLVITTAQHLQASKSALHSQTHMVAHGVSYDHFARAVDEQTAIPEKIRSISAPVFGFFGMIQDWVDLELVVYLARRHPNWSWVLIGKQEISTHVCEEYPNIYRLGQVPFADLPGYCKAFDVGLIPFKINPLTINVNPIKLREYLAAGLPVVSTDLPEVRAYRPHVLIGESYEAFDQACQQALQQRSTQHRALRQDVVRHETWDAKVEQLSALVEKILMSRNVVETCS